jgi:hypothetical protein
MSTTPRSLALRHGDATAFLDLVQATYAPAIAFARTRSADAAAAESLLLDAYVAAYVRRREAPVERPETWVLHTVMSECVARASSPTDALPATRAPRWRARARIILARTGSALSAHRCGPARHAARLGLGLLVPAIVLLLGNACREPLTDPLAAVIQRGGSGALGDTLRVELGHAVETAAGFTVGFVQLVDDSRCPLDAVCVWEGDAAVRTRVARRGVAVDSVLHTSGRMGRGAMTVAGHDVRLVGVEPYPVAGRPRPAGTRSFALYVVSPAGTPPRSDTLPGPPSASDSAAQALRTDAVALAIRQVRAQRGPAQPEVPAALVESLRRALAAVRSSRSPARDTVIDLYRVRAAPETQELIVGVDPAQPWVRAWQRGELVTGNAAIDAIVRQYGLAFRQYHPWSSGPAAILRASARPLNVTAIAPAFARVAGVRYAEPNQIVGGSHDITPEPAGDAWVLTYSLGYGDCMAGCIHRRFWSFRVAASGTVTYLGSRGSPPPERGSY